MVANHSIEHKNSSSLEFTLLCVGICCRVLSFVQIPDPISTSTASMQYVMEDDPSDENPKDDGHDAATCIRVFVVFKQFNDSSASPPRSKE